MFALQTHNPFRYLFNRRCKWRINWIDWMSVSNFFSSISIFIRTPAWLFVFIRKCQWNWITNRHRSNVHVAGVSFFFFSFHIYSKHECSNRFVCWSQPKGRHRIYYGSVAPRRSGGCCNVRDRQVLSFCCTRNKATLLYVRWHRLVAASSWRHQYWKSHSFCNIVLLKSTYVYVCKQYV